MTKIPVMFWRQTIEDAFEKFTEHEEGKGFKFLSLEKEFEQLGDSFRVKISVEDEEKTACDVFFVIDISARLAFFSNGCNRIGDLLALTVLQKEKQ